MNRRNFLRNIIIAAATPKIIEQALVEHASRTTFYSFGTRWAGGLRRSNVELIKAMGSKDPSVRAAAQEAFAEFISHPIIEVSKKYDAYPALEFKSVLTKHSFSIEVDPVNFSLV